MDILNTFLNNLHYPVWIEDTDRKLIFCNKAFEALSNIELSSTKGLKLFKFLPNELKDLYNDTVNIYIKKLCNITVEHKVKNRIFQFHIFPLMNNEESVAMGGLIVDITDQKQRELAIEDEKNIFRTIIDSIPYDIFYKDKNSKFIGCNKNFIKFYDKYTINDVIGKSDVDIFPDKDLALAFIEQDKEVMKSKTNKYSEYSSVDIHGNLRFEENVKVPVINDDGEVWGIVGISRNITERKLLEEKLRYLSYTDALTGLYNRLSFEEKIAELNHEQYLPLGIVMGDVNGLKLVNDTLGHLEGDKLLKNIAEILENVCQDKGLVFRWGGDEFIILLPNCNENICEEVINEIIHSCNKCTYDFVQLSIALGESIKHTTEEDVYHCIKEVEEKLYKRKLRDKKSIRSTIMDSLRKSLQEKNTETEEHTERVAQYAYAIGEDLNFKMSELDELYLVANLHDIGKIAINEDILLKPGKLSKEEFEIMKTHTEKGYRIIQASGNLETIAKCVLCHHEKWDGTGYPLGLCGNNIPLMSRIITVVDSYDVMTHERPYKEAMTKEDAIEELKRCAGTQFDPNIVSIFLNHLNKHNQ